MFIIGRAIAGLGSSGLFTGCLTTIANCVPKERRPLFQGINIGIGQLGLACGPVVGGAFTTRVSWRWCFYINLPIGAVVALCLIFNNVPEASVKPPWRHVLGTAVKSLDLVGFALVSPAAIMLLLALEYGGNQYAWDSSVVIGLLCGAAAVFALFLFWEHREGDGAMIPFAFLRSPVVRSASLTQFFTLGGILIGDFYLAIFFQVIKNDSPLMSGVHLLPVTLGLVIFTLVTGGLIQVTGYYLPWILAGSAIATVSYGLMSMLSPTTTFGQWFGYLCVYGIGSGVGNSGVGCFQPIAGSCSKSDIFPTHLGIHRRPKPRPPETDPHGHRDHHIRPERRRRRLGCRRQRHLQQQPAQRIVAASSAHRPQPRGHHRGWCPQHPRRGPDSL